MREQASVFAKVVRAAGALLCYSLTLFPIAGCSERAARTTVSIQDDFRYDLALASEIQKDDARGNIAISPLSLRQLLGMLSLAANGKTRTQIINAISPGNRKAFQESGDGAASYANDAQSGLKVGNSLWIDQHFSPSGRFEQLLAERFGAPVFRVDFADPATIPRINRWVGEAIGSNSTIPIRGGTVFVGINAMAYRGVWQAQFDQRLTVEGRFGRNKHFVTAHFMRAERPIAYHADSRTRYILLPFSDGWEMVVALPKNPNAAPDIASALNAGRIGKSFFPTEVRLSLPRFSIETELHLRAFLQRLGMIDAFNGARADFTPLFGTPHVPVTDIYQDLKIEVNEQGAQVAAESVAVTTLKGHQLIDMNVDHPFAFAIENPRYGSVLAVGDVEQP